jgi:hypothetical protein
MLPLKKGPAMVGELKTRSGGFTNFGPNSEEIGRSRISRSRVARGNCRNCRCLIGNWRSAPSRTSRTGVAGAEIAGAELLQLVLCLRSWRTRDNAIDVQTQKSFSTMAEEKSRSLQLSNSKQTDSIDRRMRDSCACGAHLSIARSQRSLSQLQIPVGAAYG